MVIGGQGSDPQGWTNYMTLDNTTANQSGSTRFGSAPTSSVVTVGSEIQSGGTYVAYCFAEKKGYSNIGKYTGNGNANGPFCYTGFKPAFVLVKLSSGADDWQILDNKRNPFNVINKYLKPNDNASETTNDAIDFLSNGFKLRTSSGSWNTSNGTFIYMAFAEEPLVGTNNVPATAGSRVIRCYGLCRIDLCRIRVWS